MSLCSTSFSALLINSLCVTKGLFTLYMYFHRVVLCFANQNFCIKFVECFFVLIHYTEFINLYFAYRTQDHYVMYPPNMPLPSYASGNESKSHTHVIIEFYSQCVLPEVGVVIVHVGLDRGTKKSLLV